MNAGAGGAPLWLLYALPALAGLLRYLYVQRKREARSRARLTAALESGLIEPPSLHPVVDLAICLNSGACVAACPEQALGVVDGKATLVSPTSCIGHGACAAACPVTAIRLVFGTARRGIDIPTVDPSFESSVPGIFIAGELGGMGLVRKAAEQGRQAMDAIGRRSRANADELDVVIVGAGPAGISATLGAMEKGLRFLTLEQESSLGGTVYHYPRNKLVLTQPVVLPIVGKVRFSEVRKESLLAFWEGVIRDHEVPIHFGERLEDVQQDGRKFLIRTSRGTHRARHVLLAIGRRGTPRTLDVPGESLPKVVYRLIEAEQYEGMAVLVVGGGDSAIEAAVSIAEIEGTTVTLAYRGEAFGRAKQANRDNLDAAEKAGRVTVALATEVREIEADRVRLELGSESNWIANDAIIVCVGGVLPTPMLRAMGIDVRTRHGEA